MTFFDECDRICDSINNDDLPSELLHYLDVFKTNIKYMKENIEILEVDELVMKITHIMGHIDYLTNDCYVDKESLNRKKLLQIYYLIKTQSSNYV